jgi:hypothetical protein
MIGAIDTGKLFELVWAAGLAGIAFCGVFAVAILGVARVTDMRQAGRSAAAALYLGLSVLALVAFAAAVVFGIAMIVQK